jgi:uncharacterized protein YegL
MTLIKSFAPLLLLFSILVGLSFSQKVDLTIEPNAKGEDVVEAVVKKVKASGIFPKDNELLLRIAYAETKFGNSPNYFGDSSGGIWKLDENALLKTQDTVAHPSLTMIHYKIVAKFGINWRAVTKVDLLKPLYSGLAGQLFLKTLPESIPGTIEEQAKFWKKYYHKNGSGTVDTFIADINEMQNSFVCMPCIDQCYVLDGSGSINGTNFEREKRFAYKMIDTTYNDFARVCLILYDGGVNTIFTFEQYDKTKMLSLIENLRQPNGCTNTGGAISKGVEIFKTAYPRPQVPKHMFVLTDGFSNCPAGVQPGATDAKNYGIENLAIGVGPDPKKEELLEIANNVINNVDHLDNFIELLESTYKYTKAVCSLVQKPLMNTEVEGRLLQHEKRYYNFKVTSTGILVTIRQKSGQSIAYYSYTETNPSSALHDGKFSGSGPFLVKRSVETNADESQVFIAVEGLEMVNNYTIFAQ